MVAGATANVVGPGRTLFATPRRGWVQASTPRAVALALLQVVNLAQYAAVQLQWQTLGEKSRPLADDKHRGGGQD
jgi:hypothetical protein